MFVNSIRIATFYGEKAFKPYYVYILDRGLRKMAENEKEAEACAAAQNASIHSENTAKTFFAFNRC